MKTDDSVLPSGSDFFTKAALARLVGISKQRLQYHARQPGFPRPDSTGRYKLADFLRYAMAAGLPPWQQSRD